MDNIYNLYLLISQYKKDFKFSKNKIKLTENLIDNYNIIKKKK